MADLTEALCESIAYDVKWHMADENGETRAQYLTRFNQSHKIPDAPELPHNVEHVREWFFELSKRRHSGPEAISWAELKAWCELTDTWPSPDEVRMLTALDQAYISAVNDWRKWQRERSKPADPKTK